MHYDLKVKVIPDKRNKSISRATLKYHVKMKLQNVEFIIKLYIEKRL